MATHSFGSNVSDILLRGSRVIVLYISHGNYENFAICEGVVWINPTPSEVHTIYAIDNLLEVIKHH